MSVCWRWVDNKEVFRSSKNREGNLMRSEGIGGRAIECGMGCLGNLVEKVVGFCFRFFFFKDGVELGKVDS